MSTLAGSSNLANIQHGTLETSLIHSLVDSNDTQLELALSESVSEKKKPTEKGRKRRGPMRGGTHGLVSEMEAGAHERRGGAG